MTIKDLKVGQIARILKVGGQGPLRQHFLDLGLIPGATVKLAKRAPMGDPLELHMHEGYTFSLRSIEAECMEVEKTDYVKPTEYNASETDFGYNLTLHEHNAHPGYGEGGKFHNGTDENPLPKGTVLTFAIVGQKNCGKTALFNCLTGEKLRVGNFPGTTMVQTSGQIIGYPGTEVTDLPGITSLQPFSPEENITIDILKNNPPKAIINVVDASSLERNLYLTTQLLELGIPVVVAVNRMDEFTKTGGSLRINAFEKELGVPVVPVSADKAEGVQELMEHAMHIAKYQELPVEQPHTAELDEDTMALVQDDPQALEATRRYAYLHQICHKTIRRPNRTQETLRSRKIDQVLTGKWTAIPAFIAIMGLSFWLSFDVIGAALQNLVQSGIDALCQATLSAFQTMGVSKMVQSLFEHAIFGGVGTVVSFVPVILTLFLFLSLLEDSGYMSRVAFLSDVLLRKIGLSGRSIVPMLIGFGCSVPAIMATRTLPSSRDRRLTIMMVPFMSCSAKIAVYGFLTNAFFPEYSGLIMVCLYLLGIDIGLIEALVIKYTGKHREAAPFVMEIPDYRLPNIKNVGHLLWDKVKDYLQMAFSVILIATIVIWFLQSFDIHMKFVDPSQSMLAAIAGWIAPIMKPLGLADWRIVTALVSGILAKESIVASIGVLGVAQILTPLSAISMLVFCLLYTPCVAAISAIRRELGHFWAAAIVILQCSLAWVCAWIAYLIATLII